MHSTRSAALRAVITTIACAVAALAVTLLSASPAAAASRAGDGPCKGRLCKKDVPQAKKCWTYDGRKATARCFIRRAAKHFGQPRQQAYTIAYRESRYNWKATNPSSGTAGLYQFKRSTWESTPYARYSPYHPRWASLAAMWMWKRGMQSHWVTY
jgi:soluble lytic murein transglycosylase-like protein